MQNELTFRQIVDGISALVAVLTPDGAVEFVNRNVLDYFGKTLEELKEWTSTDAVHPDDRPGSIALWRQSVASGQSYDMEVRQRGADGVYRWFHIQGLPVRDAKGRIVRWCVLQTDIDERKRAQETVRESERELRDLIDSIPGFVCTLNAKGEVELLNRQLLEYFGKTTEELKNWSTGDAVHPDDLARLIDAWRHSIETGQPYDVELRQRRADGVYRWFQSRALPARNAAGRITGWYMLVTDIDDRRRAEEALRSTRRKLSTATQIATVAELSASIAHEINQPLASVVTNAHACQTWLSHDPPNLERARATLERIIRDGHSAADVVRRIRALFKEAVPVMAPLNLNQIVVEVLRMLSDELRDNGIIVATELEPHLPTIDADQVQIQQALINLVHNATEAMSGVTGRAKSLLLGSRRHGEELLIQVRDNGFGVEDPTVIFEPFFTTKESGMGMGLAICRSIVDSHGGRIWATANEDTGTTISLALPLTSDDVA